jgi:hypothetical protein
MRIASFLSGERREGRKGQEQGGDESKTQSLFHEFSPFSGADVRKMSLAIYSVFTEEKIPSKRGSS